MSHDIRTPLNGILGLIEIEELKEGDMQVARESRAKARVAANHLLSLINDILEMGKIEDRKLTLEHAPLTSKSSVTIRWCCASSARPVTASQCRTIVCRTPLGHT